MSRYADLVCRDCKIDVFLGKIVEPEQEQRYFYIGAGSNPPPSETPSHCKVVLKFLADHMSHDIAVLPEEELDPITTDEWRHIADEPTGRCFINEDEYIRGFQG